MWAVWQREVENTPLSLRHSLRRFLDASRLRHTGARAPHSPPSLPRTLPPTSHATMAFVALASDAGAAPTFFELVAADRLMPSLKAAAAYTLSVS